MTKLMDLCDIQYGYAFDSGSFTDDDSYPQLVRIRDVKRGYSETFYSGDYPEEYVLSAGDLLIGMDGEFNIARWKVDGALLNQRVCKIIAKDIIEVNDAQESGFVGLNPLAIWKKIIEAAQEREWISAIENMAETNKR